jgi:hypothetical protein
VINFTLVEHYDDITIHFDANPASLCVTMWARSSSFGVYPIHPRGESLTERSPGFNRLSSDAPVRGLVTSQRAGWSVGRSVGRVVVVVVVA